DGEGFPVTMHLVRSDDDGRKRTEGRNGGLTGDLVISKTHEDVAISGADAKVAPSVLHLSRAARRRLRVAPTAGGAPQGDDFAESAALPDHAGAAENDLVVRADPCTRARRVWSAIEREVHAGRDDCHRSTVTADSGGPIPHPAKSDANMIPVRTMGT